MPPQVTTTPADEPIATPSPPSAEPAAGDLGPIKPSERIAAIDILRGFALLGICVINLQEFLGPHGLKPDDKRLFPGRTDQAAEFLINLFGSGKFNSMFSILFGIGFAIQMERASSKHASFATMYLRRLAALFAFGIAHVIFLWDGDILHVYAAIGACLIFLRPLRDRWLWTIAVLLVFLPFVRIGIGAGFFHERWEPPREQILEWARKDLQVYGHGSYLQVVSHRVRNWIGMYTHKGMAWFIFPIMGTTLLIGYIVGRRGVFQDLPGHLTGIKRIALWSGIVGLLISLGFATAAQLAPRGVEGFTPMSVLAIVCYVLGRPVLCAFYMTGIILLSFRPRWNRLLTPLALVGRMPLTNYLTHSLVFSTLFYGYGFGLYYNPDRSWQVGPAASLGIAFVVYALQVAFSNWWMSRFRFGPMEWLWRTLTYGKPPAMTAAT